MIITIVTNPFSLASIRKSQFAFLYKNSNFDALQLLLDTNDILMRMEEHFLHSFLYSCFPKGITGEKVETRKE